MRHNGHDAYLEGRILSASPVELVHLLYQGCVQSVRDARYYLAEGRVAERSQAISRACEILMELNSALDHTRGGEIAQRLAELYDYMQFRLVQANIEQTEAPLVDVIGLLETLDEAWEGIIPARAPAAPVESVWSQSSAEGSYTAHSWSF